MDLGAPPASPLAGTPRVGVPPTGVPSATPPVATPPAPVLAPPSLSVEGDPAGVAAPPMIPGGLDTTPRGFPVPPALPSAPKPFPAPPAPVGLPVMPAAPPVGPVPGAPPVAAGVGLPSKVTQAVSVEAICPDAVVYNSDFRYELVVRNVGNVAAQNVRVEDELPIGARYVGSDPPGELNGDKLVWALGTLDGNTDKRIVVRVRPTEEGEIRSRAAVTFTSAVEVKSKVTRPRVAVTVAAPEVTRVGEEAVFRIKVSNTGTGPAQNMVLKAGLSDGLYHRNQGQGNEVSNKLANLPAGESREIPLPLSAVKAGLQWCQLTVTAEGSQDATAKQSVNVIEPLLQIAQTGPAKCLVRAEPTYEISLSNPGTAPTDAVTVQTVLPDGFDFVQASDGGTFNQTQRAVSWRLAGLPAGGTKLVGLKMRASAAGDVALRTLAVTTPEQPVAAAGGAAKPVGRVLEAKADTPIKAEGVAAVRFDVKGLENPVEVGKDAVYEIRVTNQGTGVCTNVQLMAEMADKTGFSSFSGPTTVKAQGQTLVFDPIATLPVKGEVVYTVRVRGNRDGDLRFRVQLTCDQVRTPVVKEESTSFYKQ
jgi:uncharacterized repeat protein (TIGR01451 family)